MTTSGKQKISTAKSSPKKTAKPTHSFIQEAIELVASARQHVVRQTNSVMVFTYFQIGRLIVQNEQQGNAKAGYGKKTITLLSTKLTSEFGKGFSVSNLEQMRSFYIAFESRISKSQPLAGKSRKQAKEVSATTETRSKSQPLAGKSFTSFFPLSWTHYVILSRIENPDERMFYEIESAQGNWSKRELQRQIDTSLFERLSLSKNKKKIAQLATKGQIIERPEDVLKTPYILDFLGLDEKSDYSETEFETAIITKIEHFLLEMGKGFLFQGRQVRFSFDDENFFVDLVLYNRILQCFVLVDLKIGKLKHQDIGQMQMYVNYYDRYVKQDFEKPSIGIIICKDKSDAVIEITLPKNNNQIFASQYKLYLPTKAALKKLITASVN